MCFLSIINYSNILRIIIKSVYVKDFLISTKVRLKKGEHLHGEEPISSEPTFNTYHRYTTYTQKTKQKPVTKRTKQKEAITKEQNF